MKILQVNKFFFLKGGPERYMFSVSDLLRSRGHDVAFFSMEHDKNIDTQWNRFFVKNVDYNKKMSVFDSFAASVSLLYSREAEKKIYDVIDEFGPDIAHVHNFNHQLTPSILYALKKRGIPVVMTVHDYKLICPSYSMLNKGAICELCRRNRFYNCFITKCHKNSFGKSFLAALESYLHHQILNSYRNIDRFICPSDFIMGKFIELGFKAEFVHISNFVDIRADVSAVKKKKNGIIYWGRLSKEKGVENLINAVYGLPVELDVVGEGPEKTRLEEMVRIRGQKNVCFTGYLETEPLFLKAKESSIAVIPSEWYENNPISVMEAYVLGLPVIGAGIGGIPEMIRNMETGLLFEKGNVDDLKDKIRFFINNPEKISAMGNNAKETAAREYGPDKHYEKLMEIYLKVLK